MNPSLTAEQRADLLIAQMTLEQKVQQISNDVRPARDPANRPEGCGFAGSGRHIQGIPELGIPTVRMTNGSIGIIGGDCQPNPVGTGVPSTSALAATFNRDLGRQLGEVLGDEARLHGHQVLLGPTVNPVRHPHGGRNYQTYSEDPYLAGVMGAETIKGIQAHGIHAVPKHYAGNEQETSRRVGESLIPPRALHEIYLLPFEIAVRDAQPASIMCAYNRLNGVSACSNAELLDATLRDRWGFGGYVVTDRSALHDLAPSIKAGVDWELAHQMPVHYALEPQPDRPDNTASEGINAALRAGSITISDIDQMLRRRYIQMFKFGHFDTNFDVLFEATPDFFSHGLVAREIAEQGIVLLKNQGNFLPLSAANLQSVALIGATWYAGIAKLPVRGGDDNTPFNEPGNPPYSVTPQEGIENVLRSFGSSATVTYESGGGTGTQADINAAVELARASDVVIVMVGDDPSESCDLPTLRLPIVPPANIDFCAWNELTPGEYTLPAPERGTGTDQEALMQALVAAPGVAQKMVVVLKTQGMVLMPWADQVPALLEAWYPGQEDGNAVANVLFGLRNPSGKLPVTFGTSEREAAYATTAQFPGVWGPPPFWSDDEALSPQYIEGLQVGYRWYEANAVTPVFPFGFGLSYTTFGYSGLSVASGANAETGQPVLTVTYTITNTGSRQGAEASQVYLTLPPAAGQPAKRLVGFEKVDLMPGESRQVTVTIDGSASNHPFSYWVPANDAPAPGWSQGNWATASGDYTVHVGTSSADTPLVTTVSLVGGGTPGLPAGCTTIQPSAGWVCVNGGWLPPGHPGAAGAPTTPTTPTPPTGPTGPATCQTPQPASGWVCVNGGWLPPGHPGAAGAPTAPTSPTTPTTPTTPSGCSTAQPGAGWVCVNGGWLPPGHPLAGGAPGTPADTPAAPASCATTPPAADWVCVNGGWIPPDDTSGLDDDAPASCPTLPPAADWVCVNGGWLPPPPPATQPETICTTDAPVAGWVCVNGGWLPPSHPAVPGLGGLPIPPSPCPTAQPGAGWTCVNGGWLPPGHPASNGAPGTPSTDLPLLTIDSAHVARVRDSLRRGEAQFQRGLIAIEADANRALNVAPLSVMDKAVTPPSGDKHDYMSQARYYWPDPSKPDGLPYIQRDGEPNPEINRITDRQNLERLERMATALALAYYLTGREDYAQHGARLLRVWFLDPATRMNPHLRFGQGIPGRTEGRSAGIIETRFLATIIDAVTLLQDSPAWTTSDDQGLKDWMRAYLTWLIESPLGREQARRGNNQETWTDVQIVALALYTGQAGLARQVLEDAKADIADEFEPDGRQPRELARRTSWDYSVFDLTAFMHLAELGERVGVDLWNYRTADGRSIRQGLEYLIPFATGERRWPHEQITTLRPSALHPLLRRAAVGFNEPRYRELARQIGGETARLLLTQP